MALLDTVRAACARLAPAGWGALLAAHGLDLGAPDLRAELGRTLTGIDRRRPGFEDFAAEGRRAIEPGAPARSLLYHAFASPGVVAGADGRPLAAFPSRAEVEAVENLVFGMRTPSLPEVAQRFPGALMAVTAFAVEYRPAAETVHRRHADLCFSRTGVARVGTTAARYEPALRGFRPTVVGDPHALRVLPAGYAPYLAVQLRGDQPLFGPLGFDRLRRVPAEIRARVAPNPVPDGDLDFWVPVHKLFTGPECLRGLDLTVALRAGHVNEKLRRIHRFLRAQGHDSGWEEPDIDQPPFVFTTGIAGWSTATALGTGLLTPVAHDPLVEAATFRGRPLTFVVPPNPQNDWAPSLELPSGGNGVRRAPEYVHARHRVGADGAVADLNDLPDVAAAVRQGGYRALHYVDFTGDGSVRVSCPELAGLVPRSVPAYSLVTAPDFFPNCDQRELLEWWFDRVPTALRARIWGDQLSRPPLTLADARLAPNLQLRGAGFRPEDATVTAIVSPPDGRERAQRPLSGAATARNSALPDGAASIFAPGWDTSRDELDGTPHLAAYGLGSPFPEDSKLCAALASFWPAVAPDAGRSFSRAFATTTPMTDEEIGIVGDLPWDGIPGPRAVRDGATPLVEYRSFDHVDYVRSALDGRFTVALTAQVDSQEYETRMLAMARALVALGVGPRGDGWEVVSFRVIPAGDPELRRAESQAGVALPGARYRIDLARLRRQAPRPVAGDHRRVRFPVDETSSVLAGSSRRVLLHRGGGGWRSVTTA